MSKKEIEDELKSMGLFIPMGWKDECWKIPDNATDITVRRPYKDMIWMVHIKMTGTGVLDGWYMPDQAFVVIRRLIQEQFDGYFNQVIKR